MHCAQYAPRLNAANNQHAAAPWFKIIYDILNRGPHIPLKQSYRTIRTHIDDIADHDLRYLKSC